MLNHKASVQNPWLALVIGNTRLHWALFDGCALQATWHTRHLAANEASALINAQFAASAWASLTDIDAVASHRHDLRDSNCSDVPLCIASVVPQQLTQWLTYPTLEVMELKHIPLKHLYSTLGLDRALNLVGAGDRYGWPVMVIDAGTALTFTAGDGEAFLGGAIAPGLQLQFKALGEHTADLPYVDARQHNPLNYWAATTADAIKSGVVGGFTATVRAFLADWQRSYPNAVAVLTGGDSEDLWQWLNTENRPANLKRDDDLMFWGMHYCRQRLR